MSVKFRDVLGRYAPVTARELVRFYDVYEVQRCFGRYAPVTARELVRFCDVCEVQRCFGSLRSSHGPRIGKVLWYIKSPKNAPRIF
jgi:hypothetical protein